MVILQKMIVQFVDKECLIHMLSRAHNDKDNYVFVKDKINNLRNHASMQMYNLCSQMNMRFSCKTEIKWNPLLMTKSKMYFKNYIQIMSNFLFSW